MTKQQREQMGRKVLRQFGLHVESVAWINRGDDDEFAAVVITNAVRASDPGTSWARQHAAEYEHVMEVLTDPRCPVRVVGERVGRDDTRIYVAFPAAVAS